MNSNIVEFLKTRKFWANIVAFVETLLVWALPNLLGIAINPDMLMFITAVLWGIAGLVVHGDIKWDWINAAQPPVVTAPATPVVPAPAVPAPVARL